MSDPRIRLLAPEAAGVDDRPNSIGWHLVSNRIITPWQLFYVLDCQQYWDASTAEILLSKGWATPEQILHAQAAFHHAQIADFTQTPPDMRLRDLLSVKFCLTHSVVPWMSLGGLVVLATSRPEKTEEIRDQLPAPLQGALLAVTLEEQIQAHLAQHYRETLVGMCETRVREDESCRHLKGTKSAQSRLLAITVIAAITAAMSAPHLVVQIAMIWALTALILGSALKHMAFLAQWRHPKTPDDLARLDDTKLPKISVMVPLFKERDIAHALLARLSHLSYPKALLDVVLVLEERDTLTKDTLAKTRLPHWVRVIVVPEGESGLTTKPRALNYALDFCRGDIIGIWDAEDAPAPDQLEQVALHFDRTDEKVACLQGVLDYYNPYTNWLSRCFTIEYASWFRVMLPGVAQLGLAIPLGGTTVFFRRNALVEVGGWDAHNVTEDADLGIRLARHGYTTELLQSTTQEEANCRFWPWIKQRSRWLKGYMITYLVHMRRPARLYRELGARKFWGFQVFFGATISQFLLAPMIWSLWLVLFGFDHPLAGIVPNTYLLGLATLMFGIGVLDCIFSLYAISGQGRARLAPWILSLGLYYPIATIAAYKGALELLFKPFYWDKTQHGVTKEGQNALHLSVSDGVNLEPRHERMRDMIA